MVRFTHLQAAPERRVGYRYTLPLAGAGSSHNPIVLENTPPPRVPAASSANIKDKAATKPRRDTSRHFLRSERAAKLEADRNKVVKRTAPPKPKREMRPTNTRCVICVTKKNTIHSFTASDDGSTCQHFKTVCDGCISKQIKTKMAARQLSEAHLPCMFSECEASLDYAALKKVMAKALFESWDKAVTDYLLAADPSYIACLNSECGQYFSIEDCGSKQPETSIKPKHGSKSKQEHSKATKVSCPWCNHETCLSCNRPWHSGSCNSKKKLEDQASEEMIKILGAKPCPKCGVNIEKQGGCDLITCKRCRHNFCWECLGSYDGNRVNTEHTERCSHRRRRIADNIRNFAADNLDIAQVNQLIDQARQDREAGRVLRPQPQPQPQPRPRPTFFSLFGGQRINDLEATMEQTPSSLFHSRPTNGTPRRGGLFQTARTLNGGPNRPNTRSNANDRSRREQRAVPPTPAPAPPPAQPRIQFGMLQALGDALDRFGDRYAGLRQ